MKQIKCIITYLLFNFVFAQSPLVEVQGTHIITQGNGMGLYETIDLCMRTAIKNGVVDYVQSNYDLSEEQYTQIMPMIDQSIEMCVQKPEIIQQLVQGNEFTITAKGQLNTSILSAMFGINN